MSQAILCLALRRSTRVTALATKLRIRICQSRCYLQRHLALAHLAVRACYAHVMLLPKSDNDHLDFAQLVDLQ